MKNKLFIQAIFLLTEYQIPVPSMKLLDYTQFGLYTMPTHRRYSQEPPAKGKKKKN